MAIAKAQKLELIGISKHKAKILKKIQETGMLEIMDVSADEHVPLPTSLKNIQKLELDYANIEFSIKVLTPYGDKKGLFAPPMIFSAAEAEEKAKDLDYKKIAEECTEIGENLTKAKNEIAMASAELSNLTPWKNLKIDLANLSGSEGYAIILGSIKTNLTEELYQELGNLSELISIENVKQDEKVAHLAIIFSKELGKEIHHTLAKFRFTETELPQIDGQLTKHCEALQKSIADNKTIIKENESRLHKLAKNLDDLKVINDYLGWEKDRMEQDRKMIDTQHCFILTGWIIKNDLEKLKTMLDATTSEYLIHEIEPEEGEKPPVVIKNGKFMDPFESVTSLYGMPLANEIDPTPFLAGYFIIFFAMCLTDAGYGIVMFIVTALALKFINMAPAIKKLTKLLMYGGIVTFVIGAIFGGWFGLTTDQVPKALTYTAANGETFFLLQKINALTDPLTVLIIAMAVGYLQIVMGVYIKLVHEYRTSSKKDALLNTAPWAFILTGIGIGILAASGVTPALMTVGKWWIIIGAAIIVLTQGREKKSIIGKAFSGTLALYNLVGYLSDVLSYSRLLALGLATAIIGLAVNIIAGLIADMIPYAGWVFAAIIFIVGHTLNLLINAFGAFIHSGRLQFVEFFTKFMEGGGRDFKPFNKKTKYIFLKNNS